MASVDPAVNGALQAFRRQALHAAELRFEHPEQDRELAFEASVPADFATLLGVLRAGHADPPSSDVRPGARR